MKRLICFLLTLCCIVALFSGCGKETGETETTPSQITEPPYTNKEALQGKKIIFIGNSYTFFGNTVLNKDYSQLTQAERSHDQGYFYQLCKAKGIDVEVTNWTFGGHNLTDSFNGKCQMAEGYCGDVRHEDYLVDRYFDYVCIQPFVEGYYQGDLVSHLEYIMNFFREENPNVKFLLLVPHMAAERNYNWFGDLDQLANTDITVCNWGGMLYDVCTGKVTVPGATMRYSRDSFVVSSDGHHENLLVGYLTTLMVYCAITGEKAEGQPYAFCSDVRINSGFDLDLFKSKYYPGGSYTNFVDAFRSEPDMLGFQQLVDQYLMK